MCIASRLSIILITTLALWPVFTVAQTLINQPECVSYDSIRDRYFISNFQNGQIIQIDSNGFESVYWTSPKFAYCNHIHENRLYVGVESNPGGVAVINLETGAFIKKITVMGSQQLDGMATDTSGFLYIADMNRNAIYRINLNDDSYSVFAIGLAPWPQDIYFDPALNRLLIVGFSENAPIQQINLPGSTVTNVVTTPFGFIDGMARDNQGRYYLSCYQTGQIYRYDSTLVNPPTLVSSGYISPSNIGYDSEHDILMIPNFNGNRVDFIGTNAEFSADTLYGKVPLIVNFSGYSINHSVVDSWNWNFGDGGVSEGQTVAHTYNSSSMYEVNLDIEAGGENFLRRKKNYICALADTLSAGNATVTVGSNVVIPFYLNNAVPLKRMILPIDYAGVVNLRYDSFSTAGCPTDPFSQKSLLYFDEINKKMVMVIENGWLEPGLNTIVIIYFTALSGTAGQETIISPTEVNGYQPTLSWTRFTYTPDLKAGTVKIFLCGDANSNGAVNIQDITFLINFLYKGGPSPNLIQSADVNHSGLVNIQDITYLINYLYKGGPAPNCAANVASGSD
jgi:PKD repeat protein